MKADLERWQREADRLGRVNVQDGIKGGRAALGAGRRVPVGNAPAGQRRTTERLPDSDCPARDLGVEQRQSDATARAVIAQELGQGRTEVVSSYLGGR